MTTPEGARAEALRDVHAFLANYGHLLPRAEDRLAAADVAKTVAAALSDRSEATTSRAAQGAPPGTCWDAACALPGQHIHEGAPPGVGAREAISELLTLVHQPNPTDGGRWDVAPGKHRAFCALIERLKATPEPQARPGDE